MQHYFCSVSLYFTFYTSREVKFAQWRYPVFSKISEKFKPDFKNPLEIRLHGKPQRQICTTTNSDVCLMEAAVHTWPLNNTAVGTGIWFLHCSGSKPITKTSESKTSESLMTTRLFERTEQHQPSF